MQCTQAADAKRLPCSGNNSAQAQGCPLQPLTHPPPAALALPPLHSVLLQSNVVAVQTVVAVVREGGELEQVVARLSDSFTVRLASHTLLLPGSGFSILTHMSRWLTAPKQSRAGGSAAQRWLGRLGLRQGSGKEVRS